MMHEQADGFSDDVPLPLDLHVLPVGDMMAHNEIRQCWCRPRLDPYGSTVLVVHNSADGREHFEPDYVASGRERLSC